MADGGIVEGLWIVEYESVQGGSGVVVLVNGRLLGGHSAYTYEGHYAVKDEWFAASVHVSNFMPGIPNALGFVGDFSCEIAAPVHHRIIQGTMTVTERPGASIHIKMTKKAEL